MNDSDADLILTALRYLGEGGENWSSRGAYGRADGTLDGRVCVSIALRDAVLRQLSVRHFSLSDSTSVLTVVHTRQKRALDDRLQALARRIHPYLPLHFQLRENEPLADVVRWNDDPDTTFDDVRDVLKRAAG